MTARLRHRGPDASNVLIDGAAGLGHTRLSVIDVAGSHQPMQLQDAPLAIVYNGETYNYRALRDGLQQRGVQLRTFGDTEVVLRLLSEVWIDGLHMLDGMFAIAVWDHVRERLLLARDPFGKKPLFYCQPTPDLVVFGSEIKALLAHPSVSVEVDLASLRQVLRFRAVYGANSLYTGIRQIPPGSWLEFSRAGVRRGEYFDVCAAVDAAKEAARNQSPSGVVQTGRELLTGAVRKRLVADVPVGAFLSGGLDSSLIVALMQQMREDRRSLHTFSVGFRGDSNSELPFARSVADRLETTHTEVHLCESDYVDLFRCMTAFRDAPISEPADLAIARMSQVARDCVTVVLSGEGSDEAFAGYPKYSLARFRSIGRAVLANGGLGLLQYVARYFGDSSRRWLVASRALVAPTELDSLAQWFSYLDRSTLQTLLPGLNWTDENWHATNESLRTALNRAPSLSPIGRMQLVDCLNWLPGNLLERGDRMTMAASLEMRCPFMDRDLLSFGVALADSLKVRGRTLKWIVRHWAREYLPKDVIDRRKCGFRVPLAEWFRNGLREFTIDELTCSGGLCAQYGRRQAIQALLDEHQSRRRDASLELWSLLAVEIWYRTQRETVEHPTHTSTIALRNTEPSRSGDT